MPFRGVFGCIFVAVCNQNINEMLPLAPRFLLELFKLFDPFNQFILQAEIWAT